MSKGKKSIMKTKAKEDEFVNKIIYDLWSPSISQSNAISTFLSLTSSKITLKEKNLLELTLNYCYKMQNLIKTYELINKFNYTKSDLHYEYIDLYALTKEYLEDYKVVFKCNDIKVEYSSKKPFVIYADGDMTEKIIRIILMQSIYSAKQNSTINIEFSDNKNNLSFYVKNKSFYMEFDRIKNIKKPTIEDEKIVAPGYYLVKELIHLHFGTVITENYPDGTHIFGFTIPKR